MNRSTTGLVTGIVVMFCFVVAACVAMFIAAPEGSNTATMVTALLGTLAPTVAVLATLGKVQAMDRKVDYLANGGTDAKVRAGVADVLRADLLNPEAADQLDADRRHREHTPAKGSGH